jgi:hypothetical protein
MIEMNRSGFTGGCLVRVMPLIEPPRKQGEAGACYSLPGQVWLVF